MLQEAPPTTQSDVIGSVQLVISYSNNNVQYFVGKYCDDALLLAMLLPQYVGGSKLWGISQSNPTTFLGYLCY